MVDIKKLRELCEKQSYSLEEAEQCIAALPKALDEIERLRSGIDGALSTLSLVQEPSCDQSAWLELAIEKLEKVREG